MTLSQDDLNERAELLFKAWSEASRQAAIEARQANKKDEQQKQTVRNHLQAASQNLRHAAQAHAGGGGGGGGGGGSLMIPNAKAPKKGRGKGTRSNHSHAAKHGVPGLPKGHTAAHHIAAAASHMSAAQLAIQQQAATAQIAQTASLPVPVAIAKNKDRLDELTDEMLTLMEEIETTQKSVEMADEPPTPILQNGGSGEDRLQKAIDAVPSLIKQGWIDGPGLYKLTIPHNDSQHRTFNLSLDGSHEEVEDEGLDLGTTLLKKSKDEEQRYTFGVVYKASHPKEGNLQLDAHSEFIEAGELQQALWKYVQKGNRNIYVQHGMNRIDGLRKAGEWVEITTWPDEYQLPVIRKDGNSETVTIPAGSAYMGVKWEPWAWERIKLPDDNPLKIRGYSLGGKAKREEYLEGTVT